MLRTNPSDPTATHSVHCGSLHCFCAELCQILAGQVSVLYDFLGREDIHWRGLASELARRVYQGNELGPRSQRAFVVDDTSQARAAYVLADAWFGCKENIACCLERKLTAIFSAPVRAASASRPNPLERESDQADAPAAPSSRF